MTQPPVQRSMFDDWINQYVEGSAKMNGRGYAVTPGASIIELINIERLFAAGEGEYLRGLEIALMLIDQANFESKKPYYALELAVSDAKQLRLDDEFVRGLEIAFFIFKNPYKWLAGERP